MCFVIQISRYPKIGNSESLRVQGHDRVLGPKYYNISGIWALRPGLRPYYLGPWALRVYMSSLITWPPGVKYLERAYKMSGFKCV